MPSGFQQDQNQLTPSYYRVTITMFDGSAEWYTVASNDGDNTTGRISTYTWDNFAGSDRPTTQAKADALARGNLRFQHIVEAIENLADCQILDIEHDANPNGDAMADNNWINFTIKFDRDEGVFPALAALKKAQGWGTDGTTSYDNVTYPAYLAYVDNGDTINNVEDAIRDVIFLALWQYDPYTDNTNNRSRSVRVFHPIEESDPLEGSGSQDEITTARPWDNNSNAWDDIGVQEINGTTTTITNDC
jgi:hypothetical protein